ncbi:MAG: EAL domain-containing protein [Arcobacteraceae bacterium]|nr:EAL domain-containing protein [Arcobacteraceae bacterium]MDY0328009.1 EAL domain-containing protein [Arcobacteraceae bacterium]
MNLTIGKKFIILALGLSMFAIVFFSYSYYSQKNKLLDEFSKANSSHIEYVTASLQEALMASDYMSIFNILRGVINTTNIKHIKITYEQFYFTKSALIYNSNYPKYMDWDISEVSTDARNGFVSLENNNMYKLNSTGLFNSKRPVNVRFVLYKNGAVVNAFSRLNFYYEWSKPNIDMNEINNKDLVKVADIYFINEPLAKLAYTVDDSFIIQELDDLNKAYLFYFILSLLIINIILYSIYYIFISKLILKPMEFFERIMQGALDNNLSHKIEYKDGNKEFEKVINLLSQILKRYTTVVNELNINKGILERKVFTDDLTGLQNQKVFELDLKNMFIVRAEGFVGSIKLESLGIFTKQFGSVLANHLIEEFTHSVQNMFYEFDMNEATLYRFFGSEFAMIIKNIEESQLKLFCEHLENELKEMEARYEIKDVLARYSFIPFDKYGTIDSILHSLSDAYSKTQDDLSTYYYIVSPTEVVEKFLILEQSVRTIIEKQSFQVSYGFDTILLENDEIIMKEAIPILIDENGEKFPIGVFIAAAERIGLSSQFDKYIIDSVVNDLKMNKIQIEVAINLSMFSLEDSEFINWLHSLLLYNSEIAHNVVFSMTSYNASTNIEVFKNFVSEVHRFGSKVILKRYTANDFSLEVLESLDIDYLRIHKDYTTGITDDRDKKHLLRAIVNFGEASSVKVVGDSIKSQNDLKTCKTIGLDAVSNY